MTIQSNGYAARSMQAMQQARNAYAGQAKQAQSQGTFKTQEIMGNDPNARAQAGQAFMNRNPAPDPKEGVVMQLSQNGRDLAEKLSQQSQQAQSKKIVDNEDGRVSQMQAQKQPTVAEKAQEDRQAQQASGVQAQKQPTVAEKAQENRQQAQAAHPEPIESTSERIKQRQEAKDEDKQAANAVREEKPVESTYERIKERQEAKAEELSPADQPKTATEAVKAAQKETRDPAAAQETRQAQAPEKAPAQEAQQVQAAEKTPAQQAQEREAATADQRAQQASIANAVGADALRVA